MRRVSILLGVVSLATLIAVGTWLHEAQAHTRITTDVTWSEHIRPIFIEKCMTCHHPGGIAPDYVDLTFYGTDTDPGARAWAVAIEEEILTGRMPPWKADDRFGEFSNARKLTEEEIDLIVAWVGGGAPQGPIRNLPVPEQFQRTMWEFGAPDIVLSNPKGHVVPGEQQYDRTSFRVPVEIEEDTYITGYEFLVPNAKNVARVTAWLHDPKGFEPPPIEVEMQVPYDPFADEDAPEPTRMREMPAGPHFLGQWVKGDKPVLFPDAAGRLLRAGSEVEVQIDYVRPEFAEGWDEPIRDNTQLGLFLAGPDEEIDLLVETETVSHENFVIAANEKGPLTTKHTFDESVHLIGIQPHLGPLGTSLKIELEYPDGFESTVLWAPEYTQKWTTSYRLEEPVPAPEGTVLTMTAMYDNTEDNWDNPNSPPEDVAFGEGYLDERLVAYLDYTLDDHLKVEEVFVPKEAPESGGGGMLANFGIDPKAQEDAEEELDAATREVVESLEKSLKPERIRVAENQYHQIQGEMTRPGHFSLVIYDADMRVLDPRNFAGYLTLPNGTRQDLVHHRIVDDHFSAWLPPTFPQEFEVTLTLGETTETFPFRFERMTPAKGTTESGRIAFDPRKHLPKHGGWLLSIDRTNHRVEATMEEAGDLRLYFYDDDMTPLNPANFRGTVQVAGSGSTTVLARPNPRAEFLQAKVSPELPVTVEASVWVGDAEETLEFEFDELTGGDWGLFGDEEKTASKPIIVGPQNSPEIYPAKNGFHFVEATLPRPGELRVFAYDEWKNPIDTTLYSGSLDIDGNRIPLKKFAPGDDFLCAFVDPDLRDFDATIWLRGKAEDFSFSFDELTVDPDLAAELAAKMAHMDHSPLHGGQFFMADNMFHHVEGAMPIPGQFRLYFYDDYKKPIDPRNFSGAAFVDRLNEETGEVTEEEFALTLEKPADDFLTAYLDGDFPYTLFVRVELGGETKRFDFEFDELTVDIPTAAPTMAAAPAGGAGSTGDASGQGHEHVRIPFTMPSTTDGKMALLDNRLAELESRIERGEFKTLYQPALDIQDIVAALQAQSSGLSVRDRGSMRLLRGSVNRTVNKMDRAGDTGDGARARMVLEELAGQLADIREIYRPGA